MSVRGQEEQDCCGTQLIDGNGVLLKVEGLESFMRATKMSDCGATHASVAILGPQSSGKSTLLNRTFRTKFKEMDACRGRCLLIYSALSLTSYICIGSARMESGSGNGDSEVQRTMLELLNQLDGFEASKKIKVLMATNRIDILDQALLRPGRTDRKIEFPNPDEDSRCDILKIHSRRMNLKRGIDLKKIAGKMNGASGAELKLIDGNGKFNVDGLQDFMTATEFAQSGLSYAIVAIIGSQSSGKSTLMNHTFHTKFEEMDAYNGRGQTTKGIWIAKCSDIDPFTIAMDFEGTDSNQRGEDDTAFEKQSTLFALAIADVVLINMWYKDIGLENAASRPLLKRVFQVMKCLFKPRKKTLLFVLRDHSKTPLEYLRTALLKDIEKIWAAVAEPETLCSAPLREFFNVEITALPHYEFQEEKFKEQVAGLRQRFVHSIYPGGLVGDRQEVEPASGFPLRAEEIWKIIKDNRDLDLHAVKVMVATVRCEEIADEKLKCFTSNEGWLKMKEAVQAGPVSGFGGAVSSILETYLSEYDREVVYFDQEVRNEKRRQLLSNALMEVRDAYDTMLMQLYSNTVKSLKTCMVEFDKGCEDLVSYLQYRALSDAAIQQSEWSASKFREKLICDMLSEMMKLKGTSSQRTVPDPSLQNTFMGATVLDPLASDTWEEVSPEATTLLKPEDCKSLWMNIIEKIKPMVTGARSRQGWLKMKEAVQAGPVSGFGGAVSSILETYLSDFLDLASYLQYCALSDAAIQQSEWSASKLREKLICDMLSEMMKLKGTRSPEATTLLKPEDFKSSWMNFIEKIKHMVTRARSRQAGQSTGTQRSRILSPYSPSCQVNLNSVPAFPHGGVRLQNRKSKVELSIKSLPSLLFSYVKLLLLKHKSRAVGLSYTITMAEDCCSFHLISGAGVLNVEGLENFTRTTNLAQRRLSYAAVAIIGPQSSGILATFFLLCTLTIGKSTLLNQLFRTDFTMMDAYEGRGQTTQGIWIGKGIGIEPFTIAMDVEGSDSSERGQDGTTTFEKRSALFALAIADIVIINMWCHDIGREHAASRPLLKTVFEIWAAAAKTKALGWNLGDYFNVEIIALPNYVHEKERFNEQVALLRQRFIHSISPGGLAGDRKDVQPASGFSLRAEQIWKTIKENKDLDLPALEVMVATFRCDQIAKEKLSRLKLDETWLAMRKALKSGPVSEFGKKLSSILENYLSPYDMETMGYEERIRKDRRQRLETEALEAVYPAYAAMLQHLRSIALKSFKTKLEKTVTEKRGDGFKAFVDSCGRSIMLEFKKGCEDATIKKRVSGWVAGEANVKEKLQLEIENLKSDKKAEYEAEGKKIQKEKIKKGVTTSAGVVAGVTVGAALTLVSDPVTAAATGLGVSAATIQLIDVVRDVVRIRS
ncbi:hypothetical protein POTOM_043414 [Populus tomentosa]|uniref:GB1/RHD3-type G domain-containing protein n=1 Tax=Populus tomentosa TaxID=118781 RepID=A0A8X8CHA9_POPTO|nr:hypothetical protein POTOM_043414 [Populus tomentosa]